MANQIIVTPAQIVQIHSIILETRHVQLVQIHAWYFLNFDYEF